MRACGCVCVDWLFKHAVEARTSVAVQHTCFITTLITSCSVAKSQSPSLKANGETQYDQRQTLQRNVNKKTRNCTPQLKRSRITHRITHRGACSTQAASKLPPYARAHHHKQKQKQKEGANLFKKRAFSRAWSQVR